MPSVDSSLAALQDFQARFDAAHGLGFPAAPGDRSAQLHRIEFATLALAGEVGELANVVKKARRAMWTGAGAELDRERCADELADVVAYTLKLANLLGVDLEAAYRDKMDRNRARFGSLPPVVSLMGPPGAGKTTVARLLPDGMQVHVERHEQNPDLELMAWRDHDQALASQRWFLTSAHAFAAAARPEQALVLDQDPRAVVAVYGRQLADSGWLDAVAMQTLTADLETVERRLGAWPGGRVVLLLDAEPAVLEQRVARRDGRSLGIDWITDIRRRFHAFAGGLDGVPVLRTDERSPEDIATVVRERIGAA